MRAVRVTAGTKGSSDSSYLKLAAIPLRPESHREEDEIAPALG
jgi:hypothetical protein